MKNICLIFIVFTITISLFTCKKSSTIQNKNSSDNINKNLAIQQDYDQNGFIYGNKLEVVKKNLGDPKEIKITEIKNLHNKNQIDNVYELFYDGLYYKTYKISSDQKELIMQITITSDKFDTKYNLKVGDNKQKIIEILGNPNQDENNVMYYIGEKYGPVGYQFHVENNKIIKINWNGYVD